MVVVGSFLNGTALPMVAGIAACATLALILGQVTLRTADSETAPLEPATD
jgi:DHA1 family bicyclomycin/chloramphenicol resistance-like MFS transporter